MLLMYWSADEVASISGDPPTTEELLSLSHNVCRSDESEARPQALLIPQDSNELKIESFEMTWERKYKQGGDPFQENKNI